MFRQIRDRLPRSPLKLALVGMGLLPAIATFSPFLKPAVAANPYDICAEDLLRRQLPPESVALACSSVLDPEELSECVVDIDVNTDIIASDALAACQQVRRPLELATCVVDIAEVSEVSDAPAILQFCGSSLLPERFAQCVVGLKNEIDLITTQALAICIDAGDRIIDPAPDFIPGKEPPSEPPPTDNLPST